MKPYSGAVIYSRAKGISMLLMKPFLLFLFLFVFTSHSHGQKITTKFLIGTWEGKLESFVFLNDSILNYRTSDFISLKMIYKLKVHSNLISLCMQGCDSGCTNFKINCLIKPINHNSIKIQSSFGRDIITKWDLQETDANTEILVRKTI